MDYVLSQRLPPELVDIICREVHRLNMKPVFNQIKYNVVWIRYEDKNTFMTSNTVNFYSLLMNGEEEWRISHTKNPSIKHLH